MQAGEAVQLLRSTLELARSHYGSRSHPACLALLLDIADGLGVVAGAVGARAGRLQEEGSVAGEEADIAELVSGERVGVQLSLFWTVYGRAESSYEI